MNLAPLGSRGLLVLDASRPLVATLITYVAKYKISLHIDSAAGAVTVYCLLAGPVFLAFSPLIVLIAWARWKLETHSPLQAITDLSMEI